MDPEDRKLLQRTAEGVARIEGRMQAIQEGHERELRAVHSRITEVKGDLDGDIKDLREERRKPALVAGAGGAGVIVGLVEVIKMLLGMKVGGGGGG